MRSRARDLAAALAAATLAVQLVPSGLPLAAGVAHLVFHLSPRSGLEQLQGRSARGPGDPGSDGAVFFHRHGPGQPLHAHSVEVDRILRAVAPPLHPQVGPTTPAGGQVDQHVPSTPHDGSTTYIVKDIDVVGAKAPALHFSHSPPIPPPRT